jgi:NAD(P)H dehydrogenase (quinone)
MDVLVVFAHPDPGSLTASVARTIAARLEPEHTVVVADLSAEGFSPAFTTEDLQAYRTAGDVPGDVRAEQERVDRADCVVFVHPIHWWGAPALLKGWFDRVFSHGWAYGSTQHDGSPAAALSGKRIHLVGLGASGVGTYDRHGYAAGMRTAIDHGIFNYCHAPVASSRILHCTEDDDLEARLPEFLGSTVSDIRQSMEESEDRPAGLGRSTPRLDPHQLDPMDRAPADHETHRATGGLDSMQVETLACSHR